MRTQGAFYADTPHGGGMLWYGASAVNWNLVASVAFTRNAAGDYSLNMAASLGPVTITASLADVKRQTLAEELANGASSPASLPFQEQFGNAAGATGYPAGAPGLPPFTGATQLTVPTAMTPKGIRVYSVSVVYLITGAALTLSTVNLYRVNYANNVANAISANLLASSALSTATQANPYVTTVAVTSPVFETALTTDLVCEVQATTQAAGAYRFYGIGFNCDFNFD